MKTAGGIVALIGGLFGVILAFVTLGIGGLGGAFGGEGAETVIGFGWAGIFLSLALIALAVISIFTSSVFPPVVVIVLSLVNVIAGGTLVAIFMVLSLIGGIIALVGVRREANLKGGVTS